jgi:hypothetical protein
MCIENMEGDYYIPGTKPDNAEGVWKEAQAGCWWKWNITVSTNSKNSWVIWGVCSPLVQQEATNEAVLTWASRVQSDYNRKAPKNASSKQKALSLKSMLDFLLI